jgi:hypothetical protein
MITLQCISTQPVEASLSKQYEADKIGKVSSVCLKYGETISFSDANILKEKHVQLFIAKKRLVEVKPKVKSSSKPSNIENPKPKVVVDSIKEKKEDIKTN